MATRTTATLAEIWPMLRTPLMKAVADHEPPLPELERVDVSIRPLRADVWPPLPCGCAINDCKCENGQ